MSRTTAGIRADPASRVADLTRKRPEWQSWLRLVSMAESEAAECRWSSAAGRAQSRTAPPGAPLLHHGALRVNAEGAHRLFRQLAEVASELAGATSLRDFRPSPAEAVRLVGFSVRYQEDELAGLAAERGLNPGALGSVAHLAALPVLRSAGRALQSSIPQHWPHGYCPICAAWPIFAERRGLDRSRRLRCGRCATEWEVQWLYCIYCGERHHERLGFLEPEGQGEMLKVETCLTCKAYLKSISSLQGFPAFELLLQDLETVELDLVALDEGYHRPSKTGFALELNIAS